MKLAHFAVLVPLFFHGLVASPASAQCTATTCPIGPASNSRTQIGNGLPLPITERRPGTVPGLMAPGGVNTAGMVFDAGGRVGADTGRVP